MTGQANPPKPSRQSASGAAKARRDVMDGIVAAFNPTRVLYMDMLGEDRIIGAAAKRHNVCFLTGQSGRGATVNPEGVDLLANGLTRARVALGAVTDGSGRPRHGAMHPDGRPGGGRRLLGPSRQLR